MIPKKIHYLHNGGYDTLSDIELQWINTTKGNNLDFSIKMWDTNKFEKDLVYNKAKIVFEEGGFCITPDIVFETIPIEWLKLNTIISKSNKWNLSTDIIAGNKRNRFFKSMSIGNSKEDLNTLCCKIHGKFTITNPLNDTFVDSSTFKSIIDPILTPHKLPNKYNEDSMIYRRYWDNVTTNKNIEVTAIEL